MVTDEAITLIYEQTNQKMLFWGFDKTKKCLGGEYILSALIGVIMHFLNFILLYISSSISTIYPSPDLLAPKKNQLAMIPSFTFMIFSVLRFIFAEVEEALPYAIYFSLAILSYHALMLFFGLLFPLQYNKQITLFRQFKSILIITVQIHLLVLWQIDGSGRFLQQHFQKSAFVLMMGAVVVGKIVVVASRNTDISTKSLDFDINQEKTVVYILEQFKKNTNDKEKGLFFYRLFFRHKMDCASVKCLCRIPKLYIYFSPQKQFDPTPLSTALFVTSNMLEKRLEKRMASLKGEFSGEALDSFFLFSMYSAKNMGSINKIILFISSLSGAVKKNDAKVGGNQFAKGLLGRFIRKIHSLEGGEKGKKMNLVEVSYRLTIIKTLIEKRITEFNLGIPPTDWSYSYVTPFSSNVNNAIANRQTKHLPSLAFNNKDVSFSIFSFEGNLGDTILPMYESVTFINNLRDLSTELSNSLKAKKLILSDLLSGSSSFVPRCKNYSDNCSLIEKLLREFHISGKELLEYFAFQEMFYWIYIREDLVKAREALRLFTSKRLTKLFGNILETVAEPQHPREKLAIVGASGEPDNLHSITYVSSGVSDLGFDPATAIGVDMKVILPAGVAEFHRELFLPERRMAYGKQLKKSIDFFAKNSTGSIVPGSLISRMNGSLKNGLEYYGFMSYTTQTSEEVMYMIVDETLNISDICATAKQFFKPGLQLQSVNPELHEYLKDFLKDQEKIELEDNPTEVQKRDFSYLMRNQIFDKRIPLSVNITANMHTSDKIYNTEIYGSNSVTVHAKLQLMRISEFNKTFITIIMNPITEEYLENKQMKRKLLTLRPDSEAFKEKEQMKQDQEIKILNSAISPSSHTVSSLNAFFQEDLKQSFVNLSKNILTIPPKINVIEPNSPRLKLPEEELRYAQQGALNTTMRQPAFTTNLTEQTNITRSIPTSQSIIQTLRLNRKKALGQHIFFNPSSPPLKSFSLQTTLQSNDLQEIPASRTPREYRLGETQRNSEAAEIGSEVRVVGQDAESDFVRGIRGDGNGAWGHAVSVSEYFAEVMEAKKSLMILSRFIHHSINFKGIKRITALFASMYVLLIVLIFAMYTRSTLIITRFTRVTADLSILDTHEYLVWTCARQLLDIEVGRMAAMGALYQNSYAQFDIPEIEDHVRMIFNQPGFAGQLPVSLLRMTRKYEDSNFKEYHKMEEFLNKPLQITILKEGTGELERSQMGLMDATRYLQSKMDWFTIGENNVTYPAVSSPSERLNSPVEELIRDNCMNSLSTRFLEGTFKH